MRALLVSPIKNSYMGILKHPQLGLGYLATAARRHGHDVSLLDCLIEGITFSNWEEEIEKREPELVGFIVYSANVKEVTLSLRLIKRSNPNIVTVVGGPHITGLKCDSLRHFQDADYGFIGEAELGFPLLLDFIEKGKGSLQDIPGLMWREGNQIQKNAQIWVEDLDILGFPAWDLIRLERYAQPGAIVSRGTGVIISTRGCPLQCSFCGVRDIAGMKIRKRSIGHLMQEIRFLKKEYGIDKLVMPDVNFTASREFATEFFNRAIEEDLNLKFIFPNGFRLDTLTGDLLALMRRAGVERRVAVGIESGSNRVLKMMRKNLNVKIVKEKIGLMNEVGFKPIGYFILGYPGETIEEMKETIRLSLNLQLSQAAFSPLHPYPGTPIFDQLRKAGEITEDFDFSTLRTDQVAYAPRGMSKAHLARIRKYAIMRFYLRPRIVMGLLANYERFRFALVKFLQIFIISRDKN